MSILVHTPVWVWLILLLLIVFCIRQMAPRKLHGLQIVIAPTMCVLALVVSAASIPISCLVGLFAGSGIGLLLGMAMFKNKPLLIKQPDACWLQKGSSVPLVAYLCIFVSRFVAGVLPHMPTLLLPAYTLSVLSSVTGVGVGVLLSIIMFRNNDVD